MKNRMCNLQWAAGKLAGLIHPGNFLHMRDFLPIQTVRKYFVTLRFHTRMRAITAHGAIHHVVEDSLPGPARLAEVERRTAATPGIAFDMLEQLPQGKPVLTRHHDGVITLKVAEADDAQREAIRAAMHEPYRTLLGYLRHEVGHFHWADTWLAQHADRWDLAIIDVFIAQGNGLKLLGAHRLRLPVLRSEASSPDTHRACWIAHERRPCSPALPPMR